MILEVFGRLGSSGGLVEGAGEGAVLGLRTTYFVQLVGAGWSTSLMARAREPVNSVSSSSGRRGSRASSTVSGGRLAASFRILSWLAVDAAEGVREQAVDDLQGFLQCKQQL